MMLYIFSVNGTLVTPHVEYEPLPGRVARLGALRGQGHTVGVILPSEDLSIRRALRSAFTVERNEASPNLAQLMHTLGYGKDETFLIGNSPSDQLEARHAGIEFMWSKDFFRK